MRGFCETVRSLPNLRTQYTREVQWLPMAATNLAIGKPVTCGAADGPLIGDLTMLTDNDPRSGDFDFVELDPGPQWVQVDLGESHELYAIGVWHYYRNGHVFIDVIVQIADDAELTKNVRTPFNNDDDNSAGQGEGEDETYIATPWPELVTARQPNGDPSRARYVRV